MKSINSIGIVLIFGTLMFGNFACVDKVSSTKTFTANKPEYMSYTEFRSAVKQSPVRTLKNTGKMYFYNNYIFINELLEGVHVIDNSDPRNPQVLTFIEIPGNVDIVIKNDRLYADSYIDLVVLNISDLNNITAVTRIENVFPYALPEFDPDFPIAEIDETKGVVTGWTIAEVTQEEEYTWRGSILPIYKDEVDAEAMDDGNSSGVSGSLARIVLYDNYIYSVHNSTLKVFNISAPDAPSFVRELNTWRVSETLFVHKNFIFSGTETGMVVYSIANPENPVEISSFEHIQSCDPVAVEGDYAYVTLREGSMCGGGVNQLDIIDISAITNPRFVNSYPLTNPYGLGANGNTLFVCDGTAGLKVYDVSNPENTLILGEFSDIHAKDVIAFDSRLFLIGEDGFYQYAWTEGQTTMELLSHILTE